MHYNKIVEEKKNDHDRKKFNTIMEKFEKEGMELLEGGKN